MKDSLEQGQIFKTFLEHAQKKKETLVNGKPLHTLEH